MQYLSNETFSYMFAVLVHTDELLEPNIFATLTILKAVSNILTTRWQKLTAAEP